jgi:hypothetical protein
MSMLRQRLKGAERRRIIMFIASVLQDHAGMCHVLSKYTHKIIYITFKSVIYGLSFSIEPAYEETMIDD